MYPEILFHDKKPIKAGDLFLDKNGDEILIDNVDPRYPQRISYILNPKKLPENTRYRKPIDFADQLIEKLIKRLN